MGDVGDFWNDVKAARKAAGLPARRGHKRKAETVKFTPAHAKAGWVKHTDWHWQIKLASGLLDYWPSKSKWMWEHQVKIGPFSEIAAFIASNPSASSVEMKRRAKRVRKSVVAALYDVLETFSGIAWAFPDVGPDGWKLPCPTCGGGLFWRVRDTDPWTCDGCQRFKGRGLSVNWLTTPAYSAMLERISAEALSNG